MLREHYRRQTEEASFQLGATEGTAEARWLLLIKLLDAHS